MSYPEKQRDEILDLLFKVSSVTSSPTYTHTHTHPHPHSPTLEHLCRYSRWRLVEMHRAQVGLAPEVIWSIMASFKLMISMPVGKC